MESRSLAREVALLVLGQLSEDHIQNYTSLSLDDLIGLSLNTLLSYWREQLDDCAAQIDLAQEELLNTELPESDKSYIPRTRQYLLNTLKKSEHIINVLSDTFELSRLLTLSDQEQIRNEAMKRVDLVINKYQIINDALDNVMEGWRLKRLPRIDQDILRLAYIDLYNLKTPIAVSCNEAVNLANRYSDQQGRKMINGILRRLQSTPSHNTI
ncbi:MULTISPECIES: transcription antitermination factor NusB [Prochlorococcus]|uniref:Transcription termination factor, NusB n=1 Tax=Prochlorococcus marinus (strain SARG / CCMP1375 / SS120) TaxID=167539 RepID=Q7VEK3_PROMA|nr:MULTISPECIES: transcription antitermination factor NusB [Prochlorococcus]AAP99055.1 Transcription termination factor, NusB [Prochlorococcus marinus subsp. marinus str. CCMP1375]KGG14411.1 Transcription termination protein NusB [Prochlorococcus marinus str. LG]KGG20245.1 Transcription termination protein NusB [Prochlorococcus marinus str. SS2]KGG23812.1 Transcription termination protein NusB [Prochlorococcus marinus str. SS35]KGG33105.1 Transcription termination protein NusB [Prochlorococcus